MTAQPVRPRPAFGWYLRHRSVTHFGDTLSACGRAVGFRATRDPAKVTCGACQRTRWWRERAAWWAQHRAPRP